MGEGPACGGNPSLTGSLRGGLHGFLRARGDAVLGCRVMPELPDVTVYVEHLARRLVGATLERVSVANPNLLRTYAPPVTAAVGRTVVSVERMGKRIVLALSGDLFLVLHLMIAGRLRWAPAGTLPVKAGKIVSATFAFSTGTLTLTEAGTQKRASLHVLAGRASVEDLHAGGIEPLAADLPRFRAALSAENHTLKRALTDPRFLSGIGNAYSDEILHRARLSPLRQVAQLDADGWARLHAATREVLEEWTDRLRAQAGASFPDKVTAFRPGMAVHGRYGQPCPACGSPVQRIQYASNETNYCATCQTGGRLLADRSLSRLLKGDWPRTLEELEEMRRTPRERGRKGRVKPAGGEPGGRS
jgi:formamidopyrimidine-DNA glycosylase